MEYRLIPARNGYYWPVGARNEPMIEADLNFLMDGDAHQPGGMWNLRANVLIERVDEATLEAIAS